MAHLRNLCEEIIISHKRYKVKRKYPFEYSKVDNNIVSTSYRTFNNYEYYDRRIDAIVMSYKQLITHYDTRSDYKMYYHTLRKLKNLEEEHPEWLI